MAHTIVGVDLGADAVKFAVVEAGFRHARMARTFAEPIGEGELPLSERQAEALRKGLGRLPQEATVFVAAPGELLTLRVLDLPFADPRKVDQVVAYELEGQIVHALSDVVYDHSILTTPAEADGSSVLAVAAKIDDVAELMADLGAAGVEPRALYAAPVVYRTLFVDTPEATPSPVGVPECRLILDLGHQRTNISVLVGGEAVFGRTVRRGGAAITAAIARLYECDGARATEIKHQQAVVVGPGGPAVSDEGARIDMAIKEVLAPLLREIRQTLASVRARLHSPLKDILLTGGTAQLAGLPEYLEDELGAPVVLWSGGPTAAASTAAAPAAEGAEGMEAAEDEEKEAAPPVVVEQPELRFALAQAVAWAGARGRKELDLRRGPFVYKASFSILRQKAVHLGVLAAVLLISVIVDVGMAMGRLGQQRDRLEAELKAATQELFGEPRLDGRQVATLLRRGFKEDMAPIPRATAFDLLDEVSRRMPDGEKVKVDLFEFDVRPKKAFVKGTVDSAAAVDDMVTELKKVDCFEEITKGPLTEVQGGTKNFSLTIASTCP